MKTDLHGSCGLIEIKHVNMFSVYLKIGVPRYCLRGIINVQAQNPSVCVCVCVRMCQYAEICLVFSGQWPLGKDI